MIENIRIRFVVWWRVNVSGDLHLGRFLRFVMEEEKS
jgi:hypothetical protein